MFVDLNRIFIFCDLCYNKSDMDLFFMLLNNYKGVSVGIDNDKDLLTFRT
mgnify:CR=1 FL=1